MAGLTKGQYDSIVYSLTISSCLSIAGCLFIFSSFFLLWGTRSFRKHSMEMKMLLSLSFADLISAVGFLLTWWALRNQNICLTQAVFLQAGTMAAVIFGCCFSLHLYTTVRYHRRIVPEWVYHAAAWGLALGTCMIPTVGNRWGNSNGIWCWTKNDQETDWLYRGLTFYFILFAAWVFNCCLYGLVLREVVSTLAGGRKLLRRAEALEESRQFQRRIVRRTALYPVINSLIWVFAISNRIQNTVDPSNPVYFLVLLHSIFVPLQGFADAVALFWSAQLGRVYVDWWRSRRLNARWRQPRQRQEQPIYASQSEHSSTSGRPSQEMPERTASARSGDSSHIQLLSLPSDVGASVAMTVSDATGEPDSALNTSS